MSQRGVERTLGKLVTDEDFRAAFFENPRAGALLLGVELSREELEALRRIPRTALADFSRRLDDRICRLHIPGVSAERAGTAPHPAKEE